jgi:hypothetical protein
LSAVDTWEALAAGKGYWGSRVDTIANCGNWSRGSISNAASTVVLGSALALILSETIVSVVEDSEISGEGCA